MLTSAEEQSSSSADQSKSTVPDSECDSFAESDHDSCDLDFEFEQTCSEDNPETSAAPTNTSEGAGELRGNCL